jgi:uncharacterized membrane protein YoaK (UPF0700 family)
VNAFLAQVRGTLVPDMVAQDGPLPPLLLVLTMVTGLVDAFSYLVLGHVFVANMTGNVIFLGFALAGARGFSIVASLVALASFWCGALTGGAIGARMTQHRGRLLTHAMALQSACFIVAVVVTAVSATPVTAGERYVLIVVLSVAMGIQNATARKLAVPDLTTTVLTLTITGTAADSSLAGGKGFSAGRRLLSVMAMFLGALAGALLVVHSVIVIPLAAAATAVVCIGVVASRLGRLDAPWVTP